ncbi:hypothetical protein BGZ90_008228 [Linnemannia elongata]|nr:hypothetical protein BGZ90_008228 [Linnemannia elongata]
MSTAISFSATSSPAHSQMHDDDDPRPSSTSVVATLRHSPRLLLRKSASALKEPAQSPDIFARGPGPSLRPSTRLQTRNTSARMLNARSKKTTRQQQQQQQHQGRSHYTLGARSQSLELDRHRHGRRSSPDEVVPSIIIHHQWSFGYHYRHRTINVIIYKCLNIDLQDSCSFWSEANVNFDRGHCRAQYYRS